MENENFNPLLLGGNLSYGAYIDPDNGAYLTYISGQEAQNEQDIERGKAQI